MSPSVVLCVDYESHISAVAAMKNVVASLGPCEVVDKLNEAIADFERAFATSLAIESQIITPALLKRQAG